MKCGVDRVIMEVAGKGFSKQMSFYLKDQGRLLRGRGGGREEAEGCRGVAWMAAFPAEEINTTN